MRSHPFVHFDQVQKSYGTVRAVGLLNLEVLKGEFVTFLGPSGSGKTTSLMMLAGFEEPSGGEIRVDGRAITRVAAHKRNIGMVFQSYALFPHMTVEDNIAFPLKVRRVGSAEIKARVGRALELVRLHGVERRRPNQLSGGQQQRVALARALVFNPPLVLMDEPLGALDRQLREELQIEIKHLHEQLGITLIYVTHDQTEALTMSDRIVVFNEGIVQQDGSPNTVYEQPASRFVASFIGEGNHIPVIVDEVRQGLVAAHTPNGHVVVARAAEPLQPGDRGMFFVRPERLELAAPGDQPNRLDGIVRENIYRGDHVITRVDSGGIELRINRRNAVSTQQLAPGQALTVGWSEADGRLFKL